MAKMAYSITKVPEVSIGLAKKTIATAKPRRNKSEEKKLGPYAETVFAKFLRSRIGSRKPLMTGEEIAVKVGVASGYISEMKNGKANPDSVGVGILVRLADALDVSPVTLFNAARGVESADPAEERLREILRNYGKLDSDARADSEFLIRELRKKTKASLTREV